MTGALVLASPAASPQPANPIVRMTVRIREAVIKDCLIIDFLLLIFMVTPYPS